MAAQVEVLETDITTLEVDAIANAANTQLAHGGGVAGAISRAGGPDVQRESDRRAPMVLGGPTSADIIRRATGATLWKAEELGAKSLALVAFGTGVGGFPLADAAEIEADEVRSHLDSGSRLERIVFAVRGTEAREAFERAVAAAGL